MMNMDSWSDSGGSGSEDEELLPEAPPPVRKWDQFRETPPSLDTGSAVNSVIWRRLEKLTKIVAYVVSFAFVFGCSIVSKGSMIFMFKQLARDPTNIPFCNDVGKGTQYVPGNISQQLEVQFSCPNPTDAACHTNRIIERVSWIWAIAFAFAIPQLGSFLRALRKCLFKFNNWPQFKHLFFVLTMEICHTIGLAMLCYMVLPDLDSVSVFILTSCFAFAPSCLLLLSRFQEDNDRKTHISKFRLLVDIFAIIAQVSGAIFWPILQYLDIMQDHVSPHPYAWAIPVAVILTSMGWWETFTEEDSWTRLGKYLWRIKQEMIDKAGCRYVTYVFVTPLKILTFFTSMVIITWQTGMVDKASDLTDYFEKSFGNHTYIVTTVEWEDIIGGESFKDGVTKKQNFILNDDSQHAVWVLLIQIFTSYFAYVAAKFASKVQIQIFSFALPLTFVLPCGLAILVTMCGAHADHECAFQSSSINIPNRLFFECPNVGDYFDYAWQNNSWIALVWFVSYIWINIHIWYPKSPRLGTTEHIFGTPWYEGLFIDQSLMMNKRRDGVQTVTVEELEDDEHISHLNSEYLNFPGKGSSSSKKSTVKASDRVTKIYACATMWHENEEEMMVMLKSIFRVDADYSARRLTQKYFGIVDPDYYEWESHILFDNCFEMDDSDKGEREQIVNKFVKQLIPLIDTAGSNHYGKKIRVKPCKKYPTPYGGRLVWTLPGRTKIVCHLKDKGKIRIKKRWSQIMYMYYLLGYKIMELPISDERKEVIAENTFLLALDGDVDFQPDAVTRLVELMKKNKGVGAACGRIHPTGSGYIPAYQMFEYAVGHWLQKATEHVLGCVLCSPGCFSLFRGKAIMDDNVMRKYTTVPTLPKHHIQFDQGEDRWLCTLLLQRGWRVEYSAASDSFTACPEGFDEFYNQRRRWMPSTMLNILDLLSNWRSVTQTNEDVSMLYIAYQMGIMIGTFIGPGGIFMIISGSMTIVFGMGDLEALIYNFIPIFLFCLACYYTEPKFQLAFAKILTLGYTMIMLAVYVGLMVQISNEGILSPTALSAASFFFPLLLAGLLHMEEAHYMPYMLVYLVTIPSMYILLVIYSLFNLFNVSWGTREHVGKKTAAEVRAEQQEAAELAAQEAKRKKDGLIGTLMGQFKFGESEGTGGGGETGSVDFSFGNVMRCMCFTHDDPHEPKKQLSKISTSLAEVSHRLSRIESSSGVSGMQTSRRRSSIGVRSGGRKSLGSLQEEEGSVHESTNGIEETHSEEEPDEESNAPKTKRDDDTNPYWIDDESLRNGPVDYLSGTEINFWREMIQKYLQPLDLKKKEQAQQAQDLKDYRDSFVFTFMMINALYVVLITMLQLQSNLKVPWVLFSSFNINGMDGLIYTFNYVKPDGIAGIPQISIVRETKMLDVLGLCFLVTFSSITFAQMIGMLMHRWQTFCQYVASTRLTFEKSEGDSAEEDMKRVALDITRSNQNPEEEKKDEKKGGLAERRQTISALTAYHKKVGGQNGEEVNLEKQFRIKFANMDLENQKDPMMRRLSVRRDTLHHLAVRRDSFIQRRRSSVGVGFELPKQTSFSSSGYDNQGYDEKDSVFDDDDHFTEFSGSGYDGRGRNSVQFEVTSRV